MRLTKSKFISKEDRRKINLSLLNERISVERFRDKFIVNHETEKSITISFIKTKIIINKLSLFLEDYPYVVRISNRALQSHMAIIGTTGVGKTKVLC